MSLSFVSKSVQTVTEDGAFEEKAIEPKEGSGRKSEYSGTSRSLFEQLRSNQEQAEAERAEEQKAIMRGTVELDEEDTAHIELLDRIRQEEEAEKHRFTQEALAAFRAAQADKLEAESGVAKAGPGEKRLEKFTTAGISAAPAPVVVIRKKRRRRDSENPLDDNPKKSATYQSTKERQRSDKGIEDGVSGEETVKSGALGGLLTGYGSSSDEED